MDLVPALDPARPDDYFLFVGNDNDFIAKRCVMAGIACESTLDNDNMLLVYRLTLRIFRLAHVTERIAGGEARQPIDHPTIKAFDMKYRSLAPSPWPGCAVVSPAMQPERRGQFAALRAVHANDVAELR